MDDDGKKPEDEPPEPARDAAQKEGAKLRKVSEGELKQILEAHEVWLETGGETGEKADLSRTDLWEVNLRKANLQRADLRGAYLRGANLRKTDLRDADLSDANLFNVIGLLADKLAGANLSNAKLPADIAAFDGLARVEEISRIARPIFIGLLVGCVYSWLTIATTTDVRLLTNSASSPLPIIGTEIPIAGFYWVAPILLLGVYLYLHLYLQRLWEGLADLPAKFPDGTPLDMKVYPWLLSGLVRAHFKLLKDERTLMSRLENGAAIFLTWWIVPVTVFWYWWRYLPRQEWIGTGLHIAMLILSIASAILLHRHAGATLRRDVTAFRWRRPWRDRRTRQAAVAVGLGAVFALVSFGSINGEARRTLTGVALEGPATWVPAAFDLVGYRTNANFRDADVSTKPPTWTGLAERPSDELDNTLVEKAKTELAQVKGAQLKGANLQYADAANAFLVNADLRDANLAGANLFSATLAKANLFGANLAGADMVRANLKGADLVGAQMKGARLTEADLTGADLSGANLKEADLSESPLGVVKWYSSEKGYGFITPSNGSAGLFVHSSAVYQAGLLSLVVGQKVYFKFRHPRRVAENLAVANARATYLSATNLKEADLSRTNMAEADLGRIDLEGASLFGTILTGANLWEAILIDANFQGADLRAADLSGAKLQGADLSGAMGLTGKQLDEACGDDETKLPDYLADYQMKLCPKPEQPPSN